MRTKRTTTTTTATLTAAQQRALDTLRSLTLDTLPRLSNGNIRTGINTTVLHSLRTLGYITCSGVFLSGVVAPDLVVVSNTTTTNDTTIADDGRRCPSCAAEALEFHTSIGKPRNASAAIVTSDGPRKGQVFYVSAGCEACGASFEVRARELLLDETHPLSIALDDDAVERAAACERARIESQNGYVQHVNRSCVVGYGVPTTYRYTVSDWYDSDTTIASFENGKQL